MADHQQPRPRFPASCRRFLTELDALVAGELPPEAAAHGADCERCAQRLRAARRNATLLRGLAEPEIPAEVRSPNVLERIYERASAVSERKIGLVLRAGLAPTQAPADPVWLDSDHPALEPSLRAAFTADSSPGWMWRRIRASLEEAQPQPSRRRMAWVGRAGLAAAALLICGLLLVENPFGEGATKQGTNPTFINVVWKSVSEPIEPAFSLGSLAEVGR